jgi:hypothetical protein
MIGGATASTYTTGTADIGAMIHCNITATDSSDPANIKIGHASSNTVGPIT